MFDELVSIGTWPRGAVSREFTGDAARVSPGRGLIAYRDSERPRVGGSSHRQTIGDRASQDQVLDRQTNRFEHRDLLIALPAHSPGDHVGEFGGEVLVRQMPGRDCAQDAPASASAAARVSTTILERASRPPSSSHMSGR